MYLSWRVFFQKSIFPVFILASGAVRTTPSSCRHFYAIFNLALMGIRQIKNHAKLTSYAVLPRKPKSLATLFPLCSYAPAGILTWAVMNASLISQWEPGWLGRYINVRRCERLSMVHLQLKDPYELFVKRREFLPGFGFLSHRDMT